MLEGVLGAYSIQAHPIFRESGSGLIPMDSLKAAGAYASRRSPVGWLSIMAKSGDGDATFKLSKLLLTQFDYRVVFAVITIIGDDVCEKCSGTGVFKWKSGNLRPCKVCDQTGVAKHDLKDLAKKFDTSESSIDDALTFISKEECEAEQELARFLSRERSADG